MNRQVNIHRAILFVLASLLVLAGQTFAASEQDNADEKLLTVDDLRTEMKRVDALPGGVGVLLSDQQELLLWVSKIHLGVTDAYSAVGDRYLALKLTIGNNSAQPVTVRTQNISVRAGNKTYQAGVTRDDFDSIPLRVEGEIMTPKDLETPSSTTIAPGKVKSIWCVFYGFPANPRIPLMSLSVEDQNGKQQGVNLNQMQQARLGLTSELLGPANCLKHFKIYGSLNTINAATLATELERAWGAGIERFVIEWKPGASEFDDQLVDWFIDSATAEGRANALFRAAPNLPQTRQLALVALPGDNREAVDRDEYSDRVFDTAEDAIALSLYDIYRRVAPSDLLKSVRSDDPLIVQAALKSAGDRLETSAFPLLKELTTSSNTAVREGAFLALAHQDEAALPTLLAAVHDKNQQDAKAAFIALLNSNAANADKIVTSLLQEQLPALSRVQILLLVQQNYRPVWNSYITDSLEDHSTEVRQVAYRILSEVGHPDILELLRQGLLDKSEEVRTHVFEVLAQRSDTASQSLAMEYSLERLQAGEINQSIINLIEQTSDPRAAPLLYARLSEPTPYRSSIVRLLAEVGDNTIAEKFKQDYGEFDEDERTAILNMFTSFQFPGGLELAKQGLNSKSENVQEAAIELLQQYDGDEAVDVLVQAMDLNNEERFAALCISLGRIGSRKAADALDKLRVQTLKHGQEKPIIAVRFAFLLLRVKSPASNSMEAGDYHFKRDEYKDAEKHYLLATEIDPDLSIAWSNLGMVRLRQEEYERSLQDYQKAYDLDPYDGQAVTGLGILLSIQGNWQQGVKITEESAPNFPFDNIFSYNTACVYGRALEAITKATEPVEQKVVDELRSKAITVLKKAIEQGFDEFTLMREDPDLHALRDHPEFDALLSDQ